MPYQLINNIKIYYEDHGFGPPIVLLHHGFGCTEMWNRIYPGLVSAGYRVIMYDRRGFGKSEKGIDFEAFYTSDRYRSESVNELNELLDTLGIKKVHLVGQCEGGVIATDFAVKFPDKMFSLVTSSTQCFSKIPMVEFNCIKFTKTFNELEQGLKEKLIKWHTEEHAEKFFNQFIRYGGAYGKGVFDLRPVLKMVKCPSLVLYPDRSFLFDVEQGVAFYKHLIDGELAVLPRCGHNTYEERPDEYIKHLISFLKRNQVNFT
ncbi:MAG TPA: alpha/beta hydrolase [Syntrophorhabdaceae bacterium]|nr:alpha/beta hydrolase [Syntrophorhabdaceae bacterium]